MKFVNKLLARFPTALPRGVPEFETWAKSVIDLYGLPDNDSLRFSLAVMIMHLNATEAYKPKHYFGMCALKGASTQIAHHVMQELKNSQAEKEAKAKTEAEAAKLAVDTATETPVPNVDAQVS